MENERFSIGESVHFGWDRMKENLAYFIIVTLICWLAQAIPSALQATLGGRNVGFGCVFGVIGFVVSIFVGIAFIKIGLRFTGGEVAGFEDLYSAYPSLFDYLVGTIIYVLIVIGGLILLIVPGIIWGIKYQFYGYFIIDQGMKPTQALTRSGQVTKGIKGYLFLFNLALLGITILGAIACGVGLLVAIPVNLVAIAYVYRKLLATEAAGPALPAQPGQPAGPPTQAPPV